MKNVANKSFTTINLASCIIDLKWRHLLTRVSHHTSVKFYIVSKNAYVENEQHFLLECTAYKFLREEFFLKLNRLGINVSVPLCVRNISRLYCLLNKKNVIDVIVIKILVKYIRSLFETQETLL